MSAATWVTSDTHFFHTNIIAHCQRPYVSMQEMNKDLIDRWNAKVRKGDNIIVVGDFAFGRHNDKIKEVLDVLNGYKILVRGNHDGSKSMMAKLGFNLVVNKLVLDDVTFRHIPPPWNNLDPNQKIVYGHVHNNVHTRPSRKCFNACVEVNNYEPVNLNQLRFR